MFFSLLLAFSLLVLLLNLNSLVFVFSLLLVVLLILFNLFSLNLLGGLISLMILTVYLGAMLILISYICAVSPNIKFFIVKSYFILILISMLFSISLLMLIEPACARSFINMSYLFFDLVRGISFLFILIFLILLILLSVTSQFLCPQGPFRSI